MNLLLVPGTLLRTSCGSELSTVLSCLKICIDNFVPISLIFRSQVRDLQTMAHGLEVAQKILQFAFILFLTMFCLNALVSILQ